MKNNIYGEGLSKYDTHYMDILLPIISIVSNCPRVKIN